jgi:predicted CXXCH cytochrome family protein
VPRWAHIDPIGEFVYISRTRRSSHLDADDHRRSPSMYAALAPLLAAAVIALAAGPARGAGRLAPIPRDQAVSSHGPFEMGACETCHARGDPRNPGPAPLANDTCFGCHDEFTEGRPVKLEKAAHPATAATHCVGCHTPHNSRHRKLLLRS